MTIVRISDPSLLLSLRAHLMDRIDCVASAVADDALDVTVLGSYRVEAMDLEARLRVRAWEAAQRARGVPVHVDFDVEPE